jgi:phytanoyl-CoA hydroxylase
MPHALSPEEGVPNLHGEKLFVNDGLLRPDQVGELRQSPADMPMEELRRRYNQDGYVLLKGLLPREDVLKAREEYFKMLSPSGVLKPGSQPVDGIFDSAKEAADFQVSVPVQQVVMEGQGLRLRKNSLTSRFKRTIRTGTRRLSASIQC